MAKSTLFWYQLPIFGLIHINMSNTSNPNRTGIKKTNTIANRLYHYFSATSLNPIFIGQKGINSLCALLKTDKNTKIEIVFSLFLN